MKKINTKSNKNALLSIAIYAFAIAAILMMIGVKQCCGQYYTGMGYNPVYQDMKSDGFLKKVEEGRTSSGIRYIMGETESGQTQVFAFFEDSKCTHSALVPTSLESFNNWVEYFNKEAVVIDPMTWREYYKGTYWDISVEFIKDSNRKYFLFY